MDNLIQVIGKHSFCLENNIRRYDKTVNEWNRRERLRTGNASGNFEIGDKPRSEYPRPQLQREDYDILNGSWEYSVMSCRDFVKQGGKVEKWTGRILVPFSPECDASGVGRILSYNEVLSYRTVFRAKKGGHTLLHFEAVDQICEVFVNGVSAGMHEGGYLPFSFDVTGLIKDGDNELIVHVVDFTDKSPAPRGKQTLYRGGIWYTPQSGIWGTVWTEHVPDIYVTDVRCTADADSGETDIVVKTNSGEGDVIITVYDEGREVCRIDGRSGSNKFRISAPRLWSPDHPHLYTVTVRCGEDTVRTYFAMRKIEIVTDARGYRRVMLNGEYIFQSGVLDQGYYPESMLTPPSDEAMVNDILAMKACGFNMIRKHIKIEPARWYYHCDRLGMLVWQDMVSGGDRYKFSVIGALPFIGITIDDTKKYKALGRGDKADREAYREFVGDTVRYLSFFPSVVTWCIFNEGWGQFDSVEMTKYVRSLDPTRLIDSVSGWHDQGSDEYDFRSLHIYFKRISMPSDEKRALILSEFGGYSMPCEGHMQMPHKLFGYKIFSDREKLRKALDDLYSKQVIPCIERGLCACVYTQLSDVEEEINGILTYDRKVNKAGEELLRDINRRMAFEHEVFTKQADRRAEENLAAGESGDNPFC